MIYVKSILAGLAAMIVMVALIVGVAPLVVPPITVSPRGAIGWNFVRLPIRPMMAGALLISVAISYWVFKRASSGPRHRIKK